MKKVLALSLTFSVLSVLAGPFDVKPKNLKFGQDYVRVTSLPKNQVRFEKCVWGGTDKDCDNLGPKTSYDVTQLQKQANIEKLQIVAAFIVDMQLLWQTPVQKVAISLALSLKNKQSLKSTAVNAISQYALAGNPVLATAKLIQSHDELNPIAQGQQALAVSDTVIKDKDVKVESIADFVADLEVVLYKLK